MRVRKDVAHELIGAISALNGFAETPGALELAIKESARRDEIERDPGAEIRKIVDDYIERELGAGAKVSSTLRRCVLSSLDAGRAFDLRAAIEAEAELEAEAPGEVLAYTIRRMRRHKGVNYYDVATYDFR